MIIQIEALDTLFFRDGRPFTMGEDTWANGVFPPPPSVFYGALRSAYFAKYPDKIGLANKENDPTKDLIITDVFLYDRGSAYLPVPLDLVQKKNKSIEELEDIEDDKDSKKDYLPVYLLNETEDKDKSYTSSNLEHLALDFEIEGVENGMISINSFKQYIQGRNNFNQAKNKRLRKIQEITGFIETEPKIGIKRTRITKMAEDGNLYRVGFNRTGSLQFCVLFKGLNDFQATGILKLGGEGKPIFVHSRISESSFTIPEFKPSSKKFKLILTTPAIFENGWIPSFVDNDKISLLSACIGKPQNIGGFDVALGQPKTMRKAVPAGSVYYLEAKDLSTITEIFGSINSISDVFTDDDDKITDYPKQGFGLFKLANI